MCARDEQIHYESLEHTVLAHSHPQLLQLWVSEVVTEGDWCAAVVHDSFYQETFDSTRRRLGLGDTCVPNIWLFVSTNLRIQLQLILSYTSVQCNISWNENNVTLAILFFLLWNGKEKKKINNNFFAILKHFLK